MNFINENADIFPEKEQDATISHFCKSLSPIDFVLKLGFLVILPYGIMN